MLDVQFAVRPAEVQQVRDQGYVVVDSPLAEDRLEELRRRHDAIAPTWRSTTWPEDVHKLASQFCLMGEEAFVLAEEPAFLAAAQTILGVDEVFVGACAAGDTIVAESVDGRPVKSLQWHCAPGRGGPTGPAYPQVAFRFPMDVHDRGNGGLHLVPGTQDTDKAETEKRLRAEVLAAADALEWEGLFFGTHPDQVQLHPLPGELILWTPNVWHCTGANPEHRPRRSITWTYYPKDGRFRDPNTLRHVLGEATMSTWTPQRRRLWGVS